MQRIMVINDTREILELFEEILSEEGYEVCVYSYAVEDISEIERVKPDLIILDQMFGEEKIGWQLLQKLKMRRSTDTIPVVVCTAALQAVREMEGFLQARGIIVVLKPFLIDELLIAVKKAFDAAAAAAKMRNI